MKQPKIGVIVINWNGKYLLEECLGSVEDQDYDNYKIIFVDNGSKDGSVEFVKEKFPKIEVISLDRNTGFAKANNIGIHKAFEDSEVEYIALLNNDAVAEKDWLSEMIKVIEKDEKMGSVAPKVLKYYKRNIIDIAGTAIHLDGGGASSHINEIDKGQCDKTIEIFGPSGCSCLYSREMLKDIQIKDDFFDSDFFAYFEDVDLNWRARLRGWKSLFAPNAIVYHRHSETTGLYSPFKAFYTHRNRHFVVIKNFPLFLWQKAAFSLFLRYFYVVSSVMKNKGPSARLIEKTGFLNAAKILIKGWCDIVRYFPLMLKKRKTIQKNKTSSSIDVEGLFKRYKANLKEVVYSEHVK